MQNYNQLFEQNVERLSDAQKMFADQTANIFQTALTSTAKLFELQASAAQDSLQRKLDLIEEAKSVRKGEDIVDFQKKFYQTETEVLLEQSKKVSDIFFQTQEQIEKLAIENFAQVNGSVNNAIDQSFKAANGAASAPAALLLKQGLDAQRDAFDSVCSLIRQNWEQNVSQVREAARKGVDQVQEVQKSVNKATRGRRKA